MKKEPIIYFAAEDERPKDRKPSVGQFLRIGRPSKRCYEYVHHSLNYSSHTLKDLQGLLKLEGTKVKIISILKMRNGSEVAVLRKNDEKNFFKSIDKLFADLHKGIASKELNFI
ncbi:MAG: hypothetical protein AB8B59_01820 [Maribacter sp.]